MKFLKPIFLKYDIFLILLIWLVSTFLYLHFFGIVTKMEAAKYIAEAESYIKTASFSAPRFWFYCITIFVIVISLKLKIGIIGAFVIQAILNLFAYLFFYKALKKIFLIPQIPLFIVVYLIIFWPYQRWVVYLFTESAFFSLILILTSIVILYKPNTLKNVLLYGIGVILVILSRPLGIIFLASIYLQLFYCANKKAKIILGCSSIIVLICAYFVVNAIFSSISDWTITQAFEEESIICALRSTNPSNTKLDLATSGSPIYQLVYYLKNNFSHFLRFAAIKLQYFFLMTRPYYSKSHNYFLLLNIIPIYLLTIAGLFIKQVTSTNRVRVFFISNILIYTVVIILQCDDYQNRFILSLYPFFVVFSTKTIEYFVLQFFKNRKYASSISIGE